MIEPGQAGIEVPDSVAIDLWTPDGSVFAALRVDRRRGGQPAALVATADGIASAHGPAVTLENGKAGVETTEGLRVELELRAATPATTVSPTGPQRMAQVCEAEGAITREGKATPLRAQGVQATVSGDQPSARRRVVSAVTGEGALVQLVALRPDDGTPHGDELVSGQVADPQAEDGTASFEDVRLSTIYGADGLPRTAGAELYRPGEEFPARLSGEAVYGSVLDVGGAGVAICFFRWTLVGQPGWGVYEIEPSP